MAAKIVLCVVAQVLLIQSISAYCAGSAYNAALNPFGADAYATERYAADRITADRYGADRFAADAYATGRYAADRVAADAYAAAASPFAAPYAASFGSPFAYPGAAPFASSYAASAAASNGGALPVSSSSPIPPNGVSVFSENAIEGALAVAGQLPFLGTVALEGALPTAGSGAVNFGCGNGNVAILHEDAAAYGYEPMAYGYGRGLGCGALF